MKTSRKPIFLFMCLMIIILGALTWPLLSKGKISLNANHLVAFYNPWATSPEAGWGISVGHKPVGNDDLWIFYPQRSFTMTSFKRFGEIPFWNPLSFSGNHHAGLSETAVFYPLNLIFFLLPQLTAWSILTLIEPLIIGLGMFLYLKRIFKTFIPAMFGAFVFAFCSLVTVRMIEGLSVGHTLIWLPYVLWCCESYFQTKSLRYLVFQTLFLTLSLTAGWFQYTFYMIALGVIYAFYRRANLQVSDRVTRKDSWYVFVPFLVFPVLALYHLIPAVLAFAESPRGLDRDVGLLIKHLAPIQHLATLFFPDFWGNPASFNYFGKMPYKEPLISVGVIPFVLAVSAISWWRSNYLIRFFLGVLVVALIIGIDNPISRLIVTYLPVPIISTFIPARIFVLATLALSVLAAFGLNSIFDRAKRKTLIKTTIYMLGICLAILVGVWAVYLWSVVTKTLPPVAGQLLLVGKLESLRSQARNTLFPTALVLVFSAGLWFLFKQKFYRVLVPLVFLLAATQIYYNGHKYLPFSRAEFVYPSHPLLAKLQEQIDNDRFVTLGTAHIATNIPLKFGLPSPEGVGSMYIKRYGELLSYVNDPQHRIDQVLRIETYLNPATRQYLTGQNPLMQRFLELVGVRYLASLNNDRDSLNQFESASENFQLLWEFDHWQLWEDQQALPRAFITGDFRIYQNPKEILDTLFDQNTPQRRIVLEQDPGFPVDPQAKGDVQIVSYSANSVTLQVFADRPSLLFLSDTYSHTFGATLDGQKTKMLRANYAFRAVPVPAGEHLVVMSYQTTSWVWGSGLSVVLIILGGVICLVLVKKKRIFW